MMIRDKYIVACLLGIIFVLTSCEENISKEEGHETVTFDFESRSGSDEGAITDKSTYRICTYATNTYELKSTGTYFLNNINDNELTSCSLDDDGNKIDGESYDIIERVNVVRDLFIISPGLKVKGDGSFNIELGKKFYAPEDLERLSLQGYGVKKLSSKLKEYKSLVGFRFLKSKEGNVEDFSISDVKIVGAGKPGEEVTLFPMFKQVLTDQESSYPITCDNVKNENREDDDGNLICYETKVENMAAIMPGIYAVKEEVANLLIVNANKLKDTNYIVMWCKMSQGDREDLSIHINISAAAPVYKPQSKYIYNVIVSSNYLNVKLDVYKNGLEVGDWQHGSIDGVEISEPLTVDCGTWSIVKGDNGNDWQLISLEEQVIE